MHFRSKIEFMVIAVFILCGWFLFYAHLNSIQEGFDKPSVIQVPWRHEELEAEEEQNKLSQKAEHGAKTQQSSSTSTTPRYTDMPTQSTVIPKPSPLLPDRVVVMGKVPEDDTRWVHTDLQDWQTVIYDIDIETSHKASTLDPLTNSTLRNLRNKGNEANAYLAYIVQNYNSLPSTIAFIHPHKDGYPAAWHTDNDEHSNIVSLQNLNIDFVQRNGYANLRCTNDPGCPHEVMPFRDPPEDHRTAEAAMPDAWKDLFHNTDVPQILATPCCAQFAVSSKQVQKRPLDEYKNYYTWLMETPLDDATSGQVFEYLWHVFFGQDPV